MFGHVHREIVGSLPSGSHHPISHVPMPSMPPSAVPQAPMGMQMPPSAMVLGVSPGHSAALPVYHLPSQQHPHPGLAMPNGVTSPPQLLSTVVITPFDEAKVNSLFEAAKEVITTRLEWCSLVCLWPVLILRTELLAPRLCESRRSLSFYLPNVPSESG